MSRKPTLQALLVALRESPEAFDAYTAKHDPIGPAVFLINELWWGCWRPKDLIEVLELTRYPGAAQTRDSLGRHLRTCRAFRRQLADEKPVLTDSVCRRCASRIKASIGATFPRIEDLRAASVREHESSKAAK